VIAKRLPKDTIDRGRVENLSDGVFAFAITLLVLTIAQPSNYSKLAGQLLDRWPSFATYVVAFLLIGVMWLNHHTVFSYVQQIDHGFYYRNLLLLMTVVIVPYPTEVFGEALRTGVGERAAAVFFGIAVTLNSLAFAWLWFYATKEGRLLNDKFGKTRESPTFLFVAGTGVCVASIGVAFISPYASLGIVAAETLYYALDPIAARLPRNDSDSTREGSNAS
jgi:uncharacterized membrane protein